MIRAEITLNSPQVYRFTDTIHRALIEALTIAGATCADLIGSAAKPWTFAAQGAHVVGGKGILRYLTVSTSDPALSNAISKIDPGRIAVHSSNGDRIDCKGAKIAFMTPDDIPLQEPLAIHFASPFVISRKKQGRDKTEHIAALDGVDLSEALSTGLARRIGTPAELTVTVDRLSFAVYGAKPRIVAVRKAAGRTIYFPAFQLPMTLQGPPETLAAAFFAGLGEKTRYGFGCPRLPL